MLNTNVTNNTMMRVISNESFTRVLENNSRILVVLITINPPEDAKYRLATRARGRQYFWYFQAILSISVYSRPASYGTDDQSFYSKYFQLD